MLSNKRHVYIVLALLTFLARFMWVSTAFGAEPVELIVAAYGGAYEAALKKDIADFESANNCKVKFVAASGMTTLLKARQKEVDVLHADALWGLRAEQENLLEALDSNLIDNLAHVFPKARLSDFGVVVDFGDYVIAYNPKLMQKPTSWLDMADPKYKGRVSNKTFDAANVELLVTLAKLNGGNEDNIEPGFKAMTEIAKNCDVFYTQHPELLNLFRSERIYMSRWLRGRVFWANKEGVDLDYVVPKEGSIAMLSTAHIVKGRPHTVLAQKFINYLLSDNVQATIAMDLNYTPAKKGIKLPQEVLDKIFYSEEEVNALILNDWKKIIPHFDEWSERWEKEILPAQ